jgi:hypothetical protein
MLKQHWTTKLILQQALYSRTLMMLKQHWTTKLILQQAIYKIKLMAQ